MEWKQFEVFFPYYKEKNPNIHTRNQIREHNETILKCSNNHKFYETRLFLSTLTRYHSLKYISLFAQLIVIISMQLFGCEAINMPCKSSIKYTDRLTSVAYFNCVHKQ